MTQHATPQSDKGARHYGPYNKEELSRIVVSIMQKMGNHDISDTDIYDEIAKLSKLITQTRSDLAQSRNNSIRDEHIPVAADELDAVVEETATATAKIMDACEHMEQAAADMDAAHKDMITEQVTKIYEACSFQDITGQRISKVVKALQSIEATITDILGTDHMPAAEPAPAENKTDPAKPPSDEDLLNGPQLGGGGVSQDEIDKLLSSFDK